MQLQPSLMEHSDRAPRGKDNKGVVSVTSTK